MKSVPCFRCRPLVDLIKGRNVRVQVKAANALEAMASNNQGCQKAFLDLDAPRVLIKLLKVTMAISNGCVIMANQYPWLSDSVSRHSYDVIIKLSRCKRGSHTCFYAPAIRRMVEGH